MRKLLFILFCLISFPSLGQEVLNDNFKKKVNDGLTVVEFRADWNAKNQCNWIVELNDCNIYIAKLQSPHAKKLKVTVLPTIIIFDDGVEVSRFEGNLMFQLEITKDEMQEEIDDIILNKF